MKSLLLLISLLFTFDTPVQANELGGIKILTASAADQSIVIKNNEGTLQLLKTGDILNEEIRLKGVEADHVIIEGPGEWSPTKYIVELSGGEMQITRMARRPMEKSILKRGGAVAE